MTSSETGIPREPDLPIALDYERLRREGLEHIRAFGSALWTDHNPSDPGITLLEALSYAITDLGYRCSAPISDLLAPRPGDTSPAAPLFSARELLTCEPVTVLDLRKLLIDVPGVRNAWLRPASRPCEPFRVDEQLGRLSFLGERDDPDAPDESNIPGPYVCVPVRGVWDVVLELEDDPLLGGLGDPTSPWELPGREPLALDVTLPRWEAWLQVHGWQDPWPAEGLELKRDARKIQLEEEGRALRLELLVGVASDDGVTTERAVEVRVRPRSGGRDALAGRQTDIVKALQQPGPNNPVSVWRRRVRAALAVAKAAWERLHEHRNLCEDFHGPLAAEFEEVALCAEVDVDPAADLEAVHAQILVAVAQRLAPPVRFYTLTELLAKGLPVEQVIAGPKLDHGYLLDDELAASDVAPGRPFEVHASDLLTVMLGIAGVRAVRSLTLISHDAEGRLRVPDEGWRLVLAAERVPRLAPDRCRLTLYKHGIAFRARADEAEHKLAFLVEKSGLHRVVRPHGQRLDIEPPAGQWQQPESYPLLRDSLPHALGVSPEALPATASPQRRAQAKQLQGYLLFFDHLLAGYLAQLSRLRELFSVDAKVQRTLFSAPLHERPELRDHYMDGYAATQGTRDALLEGEVEVATRQHRLLDHLLARFNERFAEYAAIMTTLAPQDGDAARQVEEKRDFLRAYPDMSARRGRGANTSTDDATCDISGLERRLCGLLGIPQRERRSLVRGFDIYEEKDGRGDDGRTEYRFRLTDKDGGVLISSSTRYPTRAAALAELDAVEQHAPVRERYRFAEDERGQHYFNLTDPNGEVIARRIEYFKTREAAEEALKKLLESLVPARAREGLYLVEHVLLRPRGDKDALMEVALPPGCDACLEDVDPYSFRATLVVPAWAGRFARPEFRAFLEQTARLEAPAHVCLRVCWLDREQMRGFEAAFSSWLDARAGLRPDAKALTRAQDALIAELQQLRSVHPLATLHLPVEEGDPAPTRLGANRLGGHPPDGPLHGPLT